MLLAQGHPFYSPSFLSLFLKKIAKTRQNPGVLILEPTLSSTMKMFL